MTPEEAKPTYRTEMNGGWEPTFTAEKTAEIAKAYASALHASEYNSAEAAINAAKWEKKFQEWSK